MAFNYLAVIILCVTLCKAETPEEELSTILDNAEKSQDIYLFGGLSIRKVPGLPSETSRSTNTLLDRVENYLKTHKLHFEIPEVSDLKNGKYLQFIFTYF